jgi:DNA polymerase I
MLADTDPEFVAAWLAEQSVTPGSDVGLAFKSGVGLALVVGTEQLTVTTNDPTSLIRILDSTAGPRWIWWDRSTADPLATAGVPIGRCWDVLTVHRLLQGGWRTSIPAVWALHHGLDLDSLPTMGQLDLLSTSDEGGDPEDPVRPDGHLRPEWVAGAWGDSPARLARWARLACHVANDQRAQLAERPSPDRALSTARSESAAEYLCAELTVEGLPIDMAEVLRIIEDAVGKRPTSDTEAELLRSQRDQAVLAHAPPGPRIDLRSPVDVRAMLRRVSVDVPDTRASRLEPFRSVDPLVDALLTWRKAERIATTYGYRWLDEHVRGGRLRGEWTSSDGAAGRMTASSGLHNLPAEMRPAIAAERGYVFVRADLGQIEPRVLAAVSGDPAFIVATADADLYQPVAARLGVKREIAKVAVLGAMYGSTTGESANALRGLERAYPIAMGFLESAAASGRAGDDVMTFGGRRVRMWVGDSSEGTIDRARQMAAARGRFARNAVIQGAAAEFFKVWAVIVRWHGESVGARIVLCLHDELLIQVPERHAAGAVTLVHDALAEAAFRWSPSKEVRFVADVSTIKRWSDAKA